MGLRMSFFKPSKRVLPDNPTRFEDLSNELAYDLFDYLSYSEITFIFGQLNNRFSSLIDTYPHYVNLQEYAEEKHHLLPRHVRSLKLSARYQVPFVNSVNVTTLRALSLSNLKVEQCTDISSSVPVEQLDYIYLSLPINEPEGGVKFVQKKILSLGQTTLKRCTFRMRLVLDINEFPSKLVALEHLQLNGCKTVPFINALLVHMPNLKSFRAMILDSSPIQEEYAKMLAINNSLTHTILHIFDLQSPMDLISFFIQHCANVQKLVIYLTEDGVSNGSERTRDVQFVNRYDWITELIPKYLPQLRNFRIRQRVCIERFGGVYQPCNKPPYHERLSCPPIDVFIAEKIACLWQTTN